jgi:hypothetical protein
MEVGDQTSGAGRNGAEVRSGGEVGGAANGAVQVVSDCAVSIPESFLLKLNHSRSVRLSAS